MTNTQTTSDTKTAKYRFGDTISATVLLGRPIRQIAPIILGFGLLVISLMLGVPLLGLLGPIGGAAIAFGRWRKAPLYEVAIPGTRLLWRKRRRTHRWVRKSLLGAGAGYENDLPPSLTGIELLEVSAHWIVGTPNYAVLWDSKAGTVSAVVPVSALGFPVASPTEQDGLVQSWGAALAPLARAQNPVSRVIWQEWSRPEGVASHREFLATAGGLSQTTAAMHDYQQLLAQQGPFSIAHEVTLTVQVDLQRVKARRTTSQIDAAIEVLSEELALLTNRLNAAEIRVLTPLDPMELSVALRLRSDPTRARTDQVGTLRRSLAAAVGRGAIEWGPMAVQDGWNECRVDGAVHRSYRIGSWPLLPVRADWLGPLLVGSDTATRTVTVVMEPVPVDKAAANANRQLTTLGADSEAKSRAGFRQTAKERRRNTDVEAREQELAEGFAEFRFVGFITVTAPDMDSLEEAAARVELSAAQALLDLRPMSARQEGGWVCSLPIGRTARNGAWQ